MPPQQLLDTHQMLEGQSKVGREIVRALPQAPTDFLNLEVGALLHLFGIRID